MSVLKNASIVVVHGAWADGSSWEPVMRALQKKGFHVVAAPIPLTSLNEDAAALKRTIERTQGPVIVAGHAYAGAVVGTASAERVKALVYIAALAPDDGETVAQIFYRDEPHPNAPSSHLMQMASSGCRTLVLSRPSLRTRRRNRSSCVEPCNGRSH